MLLGSVFLMIQNLSKFKLSQGKALPKSTLYTDVLQRWNSVGISHLWTQCRRNLAQYHATQLVFFLSLGRLCICSTTIRGSDECCDSSGVTFIRNDYGLWQNRSLVLAIRQEHITEIICSQNMVRFIAVHLICFCIKRSMLHTCMLDAFLHDTSRRYPVFFIACYFMCVLRRVIMNVFATISNCPL